MHREEIAHNAGYRVTKQGVLLGLDGSVITGYLTGRGNKKYYTFRIRGLQPFQSRNPKKKSA